MIDYYLPAGAPKVSVEILDPGGRVIRSFDSSERSVREEVPSTHAGANRFTWDLRYPGPVTFPGIVLRYANPGQGPMAPPGRYAVRLSANGVTETQPLMIDRDPRLTDVTDADLQEQFKVAMEIRDETSRADQAVLRIRSLKTQMDKSAVEANDPKVAERTALIKSKLDEIEEDLYQVKNRSPRDTLNYPIKLNNQLAVLQRLVDSGDSRPTDQDYAVFRELTARLAEILGRLDQVTASDLKQLNDLLAGHRLAPVK